MEKKIEKSPILITGCARSGTSMVAGAIDICGAYGGVLTGPTKYNQKGQFENAYIRDQVEKPYLKSQNLDPLGQFPLADTSNLYIPTSWRSQIENTLIREGYNNKLVKVNQKYPEWDYYDGKSWYYKGAKACQIWPIWNYAFPDAKWVIVRRASRDIAQSCLDTAFMRYYSEYEGWIKWINHHEEKFVEMVNAGLNVKVIWPERGIKGNYEQLYEVIEWLGLTWRAEKVMEFIEPKLWKAKVKLGLKIEK